MKILFVINDGDGRYLEFEHIGILNAPHRRSVEIELTPEQIDKIGIRKIGVSYGKDITETIESISLMDNNQ